MDCFWDEKNVYAVVAPHAPLKPWPWVFGATKGQHDITYMCQNMTQWSSWNYLVLPSDVAVKGQHGVDILISLSEQCVSAVPVYCIAETLS